MIRLHDLPALDAALRFTVDSVIAGTGDTATRASELLHVAIAAISAVSVLCCPLSACELGMLMVLAGLNLH